MFFFLPAEIMVSCQDYDASIDVWSAGCIFAELLGKKPLFPGDNYIHQLDLIFGALGTPTDADLDWMTNEKACEYIKGLPRKEKIPLRKIFPRSKASEEAVDLLERMLVFNPNKRITVQEALNHAYFASIREKSKERVCDQKFDFSFELSLKTKQQLQAEMFREICAFRPEAAYANPLTRSRLPSLSSTIANLPDSDSR